ncbi:MAG: hypothetical protein IJT66_03390 [Clostridia bacterium]|nr:hypothetical protein [Clostridia bacterium]
MDFFDDAVSKAKEVFDVACQKTGEVVNNQKQKFDIATLENKRKKDFEQLGMLCFEQMKEEEAPDAAIADLITAIRLKNEKIALLRAELNAAKNKCNCPKCGALIDADSIYCNLCGAKLVFDSEEEPVAEPVEPTEE